MLSTFTFDFLKNNYSAENVRNCSLWYKVIEFKDKEKAVINLILGAEKFIRDNELSDLAFILIDEHKNYPLKLKKLCNGLQIKDYVWFSEKGARDKLVPCTCAKILGEDYDREEINKKM